MKNENKAAVTAQTTTTIYKAQEQKTTIPEAATLPQPTIKVPTEQELTEAEEPLECPKGYSQKGDRCVLNG